MPAKNTVKDYAPNQIWHIYNRGNDKRSIFLDEQDYKVFLNYLKCSLLKELSEDFRKEVVDILKVERLRRQRLYEKVELLAYCLMPNHFHLELYQSSGDGISKLIKSVMTAYVMYFNDKYKRQGHLFQGIYKAVEVKSEPYYQHLSRYIHLNPVDIVGSYKDYEYSSYKYYVNAIESPEWLNVKRIMDGFKSAKLYETFCDDYLLRRSELKSLDKELADG